MMKKRNILLAASAAILLTGLALAGLACNRLLRPMIPAGHTADLYIDREDNVRSILRKISREGKTSRTEGLSWLAAFHDYEKHIKTGRYTLRGGDNALTLFRRLYRGQQTPVRLVVPSVRTTGQLARNLSEQLMLDSLDIALPLRDSTFCQQLGYTPENIACLFIPNTYEVYWNITPDHFFRRMVKENRRFWNETRLAQARQIGLTPEEVTTLASIVEEETNDNGEKPIVAGLYMNRLHRGMPLQADPTVKFALQDFSLRRILNVHLTTDSPYNTYLHAGLPPGPIRIPSIAGIESVLHYARHNYLYMCAKEDFSGTHNFASTLRQHQLNAQRYQRELNRKGIR